MHVIIDREGMDKHVGLRKMLDKGSDVEVWLSKAAWIFLHRIAKFLGSLVLKPRDFF